MASAPAVRIVLIDDHAVVRAGYRRFLEQEPGYEVIAEASSGEEAYLLLQGTTPDVVILDLSMPGGGGLVRTAALQAALAAAAGAGIQHARPPRLRHPGAARRREWLRHQEQ